MKVLVKGVLTVYDFSCFVEANVAYSINAPELVAVAERDKALLTFKEEMQNYLNGLRNC